MRRPWFVKRPRAAWPCLLVLTALAAAASGRFVTPGLSAADQGDARNNEDSLAGAADEFRAYSAGSGVLEARVALSAPSGHWEVLYRGTRLYLASKVSGSAELKVPDQYVIFAADSTVTASGRWSWHEQHDHLGDDGESHLVTDALEIRQPVISHRRRFTRAALEPLFAANFGQQDGYEEVKWHTNSHVLIRLEDARRYGGVVTYTISLGGVHFGVPSRGARKPMEVGGPNVELEWNPPSGSIAQSGSAGYFEHTQRHLHELTSTFEKAHAVESESLPGEIVASAIGGRADLRDVRRDSPGGAADVEDRTLSGFDANDVRMSGSYVRSIELSPKLSDDKPERAMLEVSWSVGIRPTVEAVLSAVDPGADMPELDMPAVGTTRDYVLTLGATTGVEAVRFRLTDTSAYKGIAINAGAHRLVAPGDTCPHCGRVVKSVLYSTQPETFLSYPVVRDYWSYDACPIDSAPDLFFRDVDNPDFTLGDDRTPIGKFEMSSTLTDEGTRKKEYRVRVMTMDWAASACLVAEVRVGGAWIEASAAGPAAEGHALMLPLDRDADGLPDSWEGLWERDLKPHDDADDWMPGDRRASNLGDGLTVLEEFRGIYDDALGHLSLNFEVRDLFVHDYSGTFAADLVAAYLALNESGVDLHPLSDLDHYQEVVNFNSGGPEKNGDQYLIVVMENPVVPADVGFQRFYDDWSVWSGIASWVGPPTREHHTTLIQHDMVSRGLDEERGDVVTHELGHQINIAHHGDAGGWVEDPKTGRRLLVAVKSGQHSGAQTCFMRYLSAHVFCDADDREACLDDWSFVPYLCARSPRPMEEATGTWKTSCSTDRSEFCTSPEGTGINADGRWSGDAAEGRGACVSQIKIRSY